MSNPLSAAQSGGPIGSAAESTGATDASTKDEGSAIGAKKFGENASGPVGDASYLPTQGVKPGTTTGS
jgi:hypothetical protein